MKKVSITTNEQPIPADVQKIIDLVNPLSAKEAKEVLKYEIHFLVCDLKKYHGNYDKDSAWIGGKENISFTVGFNY